MKRTIALLGMVLAIGCGGDDDTDNEGKNGQKDSGAMGDGDTGGDGDIGGDGDAGMACVDHSEETAIADPGFSCNVGPTCVHYVGSGWTEADVKTSCDLSAQGAMTVACMNEGFCARTTDDVCKISRGPDKDMYGFGMPANICMFLKGTVITKPAEGWPADYSTLAAPQGDGGI